MSPEVTAAIIAGSEGVLTLIGTLAAQYLGRRATSRDTQEALEDQRKTQPASGMRVLPGAHYIIADLHGSDSTTGGRAEVQIGKEYDFYVVQDVAFYWIRLWRSRDSRRSDKILSATKIVLSDYIGDTVASCLSCSKSVAGSSSFGMTNAKGLFLPG